MEVLFHFIFEIIKISILASVYATLIFFIIKFISKYKPNSWFDKVSKRKIRLWFLSGLIVSLILFVFMFSYWGNHGLGDSPRIPIGGGLVVENTNWTEFGYIEELRTIDDIRVEMTRFRVFNDKLLGNLDSWFYEFENSYFVYDMNNREMIEFSSKVKFDDYLETNNLPLSDKLMTFEENYRSFWSGWRFWLLP